MNLSFLYSCAAALLLVSSCAKKDREAPAQPDPTAALQLTSFHSQSIAELDLEDKCEGIKGFFLDFQRAYLPEVEVSFNPKTCKHSQINSKFSLFDVRPIFRKGDRTLEMGVILTFSFDKKTETFTPNKPTFYSYTDDNWILFEPGSEVEFFGSNFLTMENTFSKWLNAKEQHPIRVYGLSFTDFVTKVEKRFGSESDGMSLTNPAVKFRIVPDPQKKAEGTIDFIEADLSGYTKTTDSGEVVQEKFLNCLDLECLRSSKITYDITTHLNLYSESIPDPENTGWLQEEFFSIPLFFIE